MAQNAEEGIEYKTQGGEKARRLLRQRLGRRTLDDRILRNVRRSRRVLRLKASALHLFVIHSGRDRSRFSHCC
eukprot:2000666-Pleurochrysis_carterae.AAC.1